MPITLTVQPITGERPTTPVADTVKVEPGRPVMTPHPLPKRPPFSLNGNPAGRYWNNWSSRLLAGPRQTLYRGIPCLEQNEEGQWLIIHEYLKAGSKTEEAAAKLAIRPRWGGGRGDCMVSGDANIIGIPGRENDSVWLCIDPAGWMYHATEQGIISVAGRSIPPGAPILTNGRGLTTQGTFDTLWKWPNDLVLDPAAPNVVYVADSGNGRVTESAHLAPNDVRTQTYVGGLGRVDSVDAWPDGTLLVTERNTGRVLTIGRDKRVVELARNFSDPMCLQLFSDHSVLVGEGTGNCRMVEVTTAGVTRDIGLIRTMQGGLPGWFWLDTNPSGSCGPKDDILMLIYGSYQHVRRFGRSDGFVGEWVHKVKGSDLNHGPLTLTGDPWGHYPWPAAFHPVMATIAGGGDGATNGLPEFFFRQPTDAQPAQFNKTLYDRGEQVWHYGTTPESGESVPSMRLVSGDHGNHRLGGLATDDLARLDARGFAEWFRAGGRGLTPRLKVTDADIHAARYLVWCNSDLGLIDLRPEAMGTAPAPPTDTTGPTVTVTGWPTAPILDAVTLTVTATDPSGVAFVALWINGAESERDLAAPYALTFDPDGRAPGNYAVSVSADDTKGNRRLVGPQTITVAVPPKPVITLTIRDEAVDYEVIREPQP